MKNALKKLAFCLTSATAVIGGAVASLAADGMDISAAIGTGLTDIQATAMDAIGAVAPVAIAIAGAVIGVRVALRAFRSLVG